MKESICVVGAGVTGLTTAFLLSRDNRYQVTLLEKESKLGGHALTVPVGENQVPVDLGFQVYNELNYPLLCRIFEEFNIETESSEMSFSSSSPTSEWASHGANALFSTRSNLFSLKFWLMVKEMFRFGREAKLHLPMLSNELTLGKYLEINHYAPSFSQDYLLPMTAAVWSVSQQQMLVYPAKTLIQFWDNHHLLNPLDSKRPIWRVVKQRSQAYVCAMENDLKKHGCQVITGVENLKLTERSESKVELTWNKNQTSEHGQFSHVIFCTHSDVTVDLLGDFATANEKSLLESVRYEYNSIVVHSDVQYMPRNPVAWASWNVKQFKPDDAKICVTYWLNRLQNLNTDKPFFVTLNPPEPPKQVHLELELAHPIFTVESVLAQEKLSVLMKMEPQRNVWVAGAWMGNGFHEDGVKSALNTVQFLTKQDQIAFFSRPFSQVKVHSTSLLSRWVAIPLLTKVLERAVQRKALKIILPDRTILGPFGDLESQVVTIRVKDSSFFWKVLIHSDIGLGEAYMEEFFACDDLIGLLDLLIANRDAFVSTLSSSWATSFSLFVAGLFYTLGNKVNAFYHKLRDNTPQGSRENIHAHYDLGNDFYKLFLDETMTYSSGVHKNTDDLTLAQFAKYDLILSKLPQNVERVLEIGCGWGGFAQRLMDSNSQVRITCLTISEEQLAYCQAKFKNQPRVEVLFCDYRMYPAKEMFDAIVSIEMLEAVGHDHLKEYFDVVDAHLLPHGKAVIQVIGIPNERYQEYRQTSDFIRKHIFPGGHLPCMQALDEATQHCLAITHVEDIGLDYAETLKQWRLRFERNESALTDMGFTRVFFLKWIFYFVYCEIGFRKQYIHDWQLVLGKRNGKLPQRQFVSSFFQSKANTFSFIAWLFLVLAFVAKVIFLQ